MRRITAMFLALVMCFSFVGEAAYAEDIFAAIPETEFIQENQPQGNPVQPEGDPFQPQGDPFQPQGDPVQPQGDPVQPEGDPVQPPVDPTQPQGDPTQPPVDPTQPQGDPTQPPVDPTQPQGDPTQPQGEPTQPESGEPAEETADETEETPAFKPELPEGQNSFAVFSSVESFTAGSPASAVLTAVVTRSDTTVPFPENVVWESNMLNVKVYALNEITTDESGLVRTFRTTAEYNGALNTGDVDITATAPGWGSQTVRITVNQGFTVKLADETGKNFRLVLKDKTDNTVRSHETVTFLLMDGENPADSETLHTLSMEAVMQADGMEIPVYIKDGENGEFTLYANSERSSILEAAGDITVTLKNKSGGVYAVMVGGDAEYPTVFAAPTAEEGKDYVFYVAHPEDIENPEKEFESKYAYSLPLVAIGGEEEFYNGYKLVKKEGKLSEEDESSYSKYWEITIPGERVTGDILIDANTRKIEEGDKDGYTVDLSLINGKQLVPFSESLSEAGKLTGKTVPNREDKPDQEYFFYYMKNPENGNNLHPVYFISGVGYPLSPLPVSDEPEAENSSLYKMSRITGNADVTLGYNVCKGLMENNEEHLVNLPSGAVLQGQDYTFTVRTFDMTESQLQVYISIGTHGVIYPTGDWDGKISVNKNLEDELGHYAKFTIAASAIDGDITVEAKSAFPVNYRIKFFDNYNIKTQEKDFSYLAYKTFEFTSAYFVPNTYNTNTHTGQYDPSRSTFSFEILEAPLYMNGNVPNVDGKSSDAFLAHYNYDATGYGYDFTGSTMGGKPVSITQGAYVDGHQLYTVNEGLPLEGDVLIKVRPVLPFFEYVLISSDTAKVEDINNKETYVSNDNVTTATGRPLAGSPTYRNPTYRYRFELKTKAGEAREVFLSCYNVWTHEFVKYTPRLPAGSGAITAQIWGDAVNGPIYAKVLGNDEADVCVKGVNAEKVSFPNNTKDNCPYYNGCIAKMGEDFVFMVPGDTKVSSIKVGDTTLAAGQYGYTVEGNEKKYIIPGEYMTGDVTITTTDAPSVYNVYFSGKYEYTRPIGKEKGVQYDTVNAGEDYSFLLAEGALSMYVGAKGSAGRRALVKNVDYKEEGMIITILAASITDDIYIEIEQVIHRRMPMYTSKKKSSSGTELDIEVWEYLVLDEEKVMYMLIVRGEPKENEFVCYGNNKMLWVESYDGYVWFEASNERSEDFEIRSYDMVDTLTDEELRLNLSEAADDPKAPVEIPEFEEIFNITEDDKISCDVNEDGKVDEEDLKIMRRIFNCDFEDFDDISMRCFVLADADNSGVLDMCDAEIIEGNFDKDEDEDEEK